VLTATLLTHAPGWSQKPAASFVEEGAGLKVVVIEGEGAKNGIRSKSATAPVVEVQDAESKPVPGAEVIFQLPAAGPGGVFNGWMRTQTARTGSDGRAAASGMTPNDQEGRFNIKVSASLGTKRGSAIIAQANVQNGGNGTQAKSSRKGLWIALAVLAAVGIGVGIAVASGDSDSEPVTNPVSITPGPVTIGSPR
jgi:hypothetical protein